MCNVITLVMPVVWVFVDFGVSEVDSSVVIHKYSSQPSGKHYKFYQPFRKRLLFSAAGWEKSCVFTSSENSIKRIHITGLTLGLFFFLSVQTFGLL